MVIVLLVVPRTVPCRLHPVLRHWLSASITITIPTAALKKPDFSILAETSDPGLIGGFGFRSGKDCDKFEGVEFKISVGVPVILDSCGYVVCKVIDRMETSTHTVFLGEVIEGEVFKKDAPMTYAYYHNVIKGKSPKNAPTYLPEENAAEEKKESVYVCKICGYEHKGEEPGADFKCPICGMGRDKFEKKQ